MNCVKISITLELHIQDNGCFKESEVVKAFESLGIQSLLRFQNPSIYLNAHVVSGMKREIE